MKRLYDALCKNDNCPEHVSEVLKHYDDKFPLCKCCGSQLYQTHLKTASFEIKGGGVYKPGMSHSI